MKEAACGLPVERPIEYIQTETRGHRMQAQCKGSPGIDEPPPTWTGNRAARGPTGPGTHTHTHAHRPPSQNIRLNYASNTNHIWKYYIIPWSYRKVVTVMGFNTNGALIKWGVNSNCIEPHKAKYISIIRISYHNFMDVTRGRGRRPQPPVLSIALEYIAARIP